MSKPEHSPGELAPAPGDYEQINIFGQPNGIRTTVEQGQPMPHAPIGHFWRPVDQPPANRFIDLYVAARLRQFRAASGMSLPEVSAKVGVAEASIGEYERCETRPPPSDLIKLAKAFGVGLRELFPQNLGQVSEQFH